MSKDPSKKSDPSIEAVDFTALGCPADRDSALYTTADLNLYQRLIQYFTIVEEFGGSFLDLVNFSNRIFPEVLSIRETEALFQPEHGYACPDGSMEVGQLIRRYESARVQTYLHPNHSVLDFRNLAVGVGAGTTGVMNCVIPAIRDVAKSSNADNATVVLSLPLYSVYDGIVREHGLHVRYLTTRPENGFLPTVHDVREVLSYNPVALVLTFPNNPAQSTYRDPRDLAAIVDACQKSETFLIVDNVYQDTVWTSHLVNPEVFATATHADYLIKVFSPSKDRPGASGYRIGYYCGDARIKERFFYYSSIQYNTPNSSSRCFLALDLLFRLSILESRLPCIEDFNLLADNVAGWGRTIDRAAIVEQIRSTRCFERYLEAVKVTEDLQREANDHLRRVVTSLPAFSDTVNGGIGNVMLVRVDNRLFTGTCHDLFLYLLQETGIGILPGNAFGFPIERGNAWFRFTTIHDSPHHIATQLRRVDSAIRNGNSHQQSTDTGQGI